MNGKGDTPRSVHKDKYDVKYDLAFSRDNPYTRKELDKFVIEGWITEEEAYLFVTKDLAKMVRLNQK
tara:strand:+ start:745 stop:945 length:201 start_codon:yes stop_codon:yes gene_type:complete